MKLPYPPPLLPFPLCLSTAVVGSADILPGTTLYASDPNSKWSSSNNTFALSFIVDPSASAGALIAAVAYNKILVWQAGPSVNSSAVLCLLSSGDLLLLPSDSSTTPLWSSATANLGVTAVALEESSDFVIKNSSGAAVWSSLDHPTDTIVPTQQLNANRTLKYGLYSFKIMQNGNLKFNQLGFSLSPIPKLF